MDYKSFLALNKRLEEKRVKKGGTSIHEAQRRGRISVGVRATNKAKSEALQKKIKSSTPK